MDKLSFLFSSFGGFSLSASVVEAHFGLLDASLDVFGGNFNFFGFSLALLFLFSGHLFQITTVLLEDAFSLLFLFVLRCGYMLFFLGSFLGFFHGKFNLAHDFQTLDFFHAGFDEVLGAGGFLGLFCNRGLSLRFWLRYHFRLLRFFCFLNFFSFSLFLILFFRGTFFAFFLGGEFFRIDFIDDLETGQRFHMGFNVFRLLLFRLCFFRLRSFLNGLFFRLFWCFFANGFRNRLFRFFCLFSKIVWFRLGGFFFLNIFVGVQIILLLVPKSLGFGFLFRNSAIGSDVDFVGFGFHNFFSCELLKQFSVHFCGQFGVDIVFNLKIFLFEKSNKRLAGDVKLCCGFS